MPDSAIAAPYLNAMPTGLILTEQVKMILVETFGQRDVNELARQHPSTLFPDLNAKLWGANLVEIVVAMQNHLNRSLVQ